MSDLVRITRVLTFAERVQMNEDAVARGLYRDDRRVFTPGMAWYQPFYFDAKGELAAFAAANPDKGYRGEAMIKKRPADPNVRGFLSPHYWRDWADKRAPICVVCPNGEQWEIDRWSSNGTGWTVTGDLPNITCAPSIVVDGYHGFLRNGEFTADIEGRGPRGIARQ
jgi:hypothetical protein